MRCNLRCKVLRDEISNENRFFDDLLPYNILHHKSSLMSGYVVADSEALVIQKVGTNVEYKLTLAMVELYNFTVLWFNSSQRANEITM